LEKKRKKEWGCCAEMLQKKKFPEEERGKGRGHGERTTSSISRRERERPRGES